MIGTGLAGLTTAHLLQQDDRFEVHVFEKADRIGMSAASIEFQGQDGKRYAVDSPMRGIQAGELQSKVTVRGRLTDRRVLQTPPQALPEAWN